VDNERFDDIARALASGVNRRTLLTRLGAGFASLGFLRLGVSGVDAAPHPCNVFCADQPGPRGAQCRQTCKQCEHGPTGMCFNADTGSFTCCGGGDICLDNASCAQTCDPQRSNVCPAGCGCTSFQSAEGGFHCIQTDLPCETLGSICSATRDCPQGYQCQYTGCNGGEYRCVPLCDAV
jgi:hypothetical protein